MQKNCIKKVLKIKANSLNEAINIAKEKYSNEEYILDYQDYKGTEFREYKDEIVKDNSNENLCYLRKKNN